MKHNTRIKHTREEVTVLLECVECSGNSGDSADDSSNTREAVDVTFQLSTSEGHFPALNYLKRIPLKYQYSC